MLKQKSFHSYKMASSKYFRSKFGE